MKVEEAFPVLSSLRPPAVFFPSQAACAAFPVMLAPRPPPSHPAPEVWAISPWSFVTPLWEVHTTLRCGLEHKPGSCTCGWTSRRWHVNSRERVFVQQVLTEGSQCAACRQSPVGPVVVSVTRRIPGSLQDARSIVLNTGCPLSHLQSL